MMTVPSLLPLPARTRWVLTFAGTLLIGLLFALYTGHAWEDYFITFRVSKNLSLGHGLVFQLGERVHTSTSPLNVLLPALLALVTGNRSDALVLWLFRILSAGALAGGVTLALVAAVRARLAKPAVALLAGLLVTNAKIVDFSINGQETGFMMLFLGLTVFALTVPSARPAFWLGSALAGLQWTRPDGFVYWGCIVVGYGVFNASPAAGNSRRRLAKIALQAAGLGLLLYLPWALWAWSYFGSPVPHTIIAKGLDQPPLNLWRLTGHILVFPIRALLLPGTALDSLFLPTYFGAGGWPLFLKRLTLPAAAMCAFYWLFPLGQPLSRALSFGFMLAACHLSYVVGRTPWYQPNAEFIALLAAAFIANDALRLSRCLPEDAAPLPRARELRGMILETLTVTV